MRKSIAALAFVVLTLASLAAAWQNSAAEKTAIVAVAQNYMDAYYTADVGRMRQALHPEFHKRTLQTVNGQLQASDDSVQSVLAGVSSGTGITVPPTERVKKIEVLDVYKDVASVKVVTGRWVDYMHLSRLNGEWRVLDVVLQYTRQQ
jgi:Putative lumazine-binding